MCRIIMANNTCRKIVSTFSKRRCFEILIFTHLNTPTFELISHKKILIPSFYSRRFSRMSNTVKFHRFTYSIVRHVK